MMFNSIVFELIFFTIINSDEPTLPMFKLLKEKYGHVLLTEVQRLIKSFTTIARQQCHLEFNHRCKEQRILTPSLRVKPHINIPEGYRLACRQAFQI